MTEEEKGRVQELVSAGVSARQGLTLLRRESPESTKTFYKAKAQCRLKELAGRFPIQAWMDELTSSTWTYSVKTTRDGRVTHLFMAHPTSIRLARRYCGILLLDCTYKTSGFRMPLLSIVGRTGMNSTFYLAFGFLSGEGEAYYIWALEQLRNMLVQTPDVLVTDRDLALAGAIEEIFPDCAHLLCMWHIEKYVLANCKKEFGTNEEWEVFLENWKSGCRLKTIANYDAGWSAFKIKYAGNRTLSAIWRKPGFRIKKYVRAWTDKVMHFQNTSTSAVEEARSALKRYLQTSTGNLDLVQARMKQAIEHQARELEANIASERIRIPHVFRGSVSFEELVGRVSVFALKNNRRAV